ncbi:FKBP-type peptidyl-prolyl cis-trans isomerase [Phytohabitans sp. LJ34]|uniref:FKBP-type peptidyl-prolyl cis-trans isomerase n=1 Tax=Phytohabitans sp. LJ34 TaxID=3452217 RepID=UPI003F8AA964
MAEQRTPKQERRAAAKAAAARAAQVKKRNQAFAGAGVGVAVVAILVTVFFVARSGGDGEDVGSPALTTTASPTPTAVAEPEAPATTAAPPPAGEVPLPAGADPALKTKPVVKAGSGTVSKLVVTPLIKGKGAAVKSGQTITVNYVGVTYAKGEEFDASWKAGQPASFPIGVGQVIPGWDQGLVGVTVGSRVQLDIPADLAYGDNPQQAGAPAGPLRFVVDVLAAQ